MKHMLVLLSVTSNGHRPMKTGRQNNEIPETNARWSTKILGYLFQYASSTTNKRSDKFMTMLTQPRLRQYWDASKISQLH